MISLYNCDYRLLCFPYSMPLPRFWLSKAAHGNPSDYYSTHLFGQIDNVLEWLIYHLKFKFHIVLLQCCAFLARNSHSELPVSAGGWKSRLSPGWTKGEGRIAVEPAHPGNQMFQTFSSRRRYRTRVSKPFTESHHFTQVGPAALPPYDSYVYCTTLVLIQLAENGCIIIWQQMIGANLS